MRWFSEIVLLPELPEGGPAVVNVITAKLRLSQKYWNELPETIKQFILYHELGHLNNGRDEREADDWAVREWIKHGNTPSAALAAQWDVFSFKNDEHMVRLRALLNKALHYDFHFNGNTNIKF